MNKSGKRRLIEHVLFWLLALALLTLYFGADKPSYLISLRNNLFYLPVHLLYFYSLSYFVIPGYLYTKKFFKFFLLLMLSVFLAAFFTRLIDLFFVEPYLYDLQKKAGIKFNWEKMEGTFSERLLKPYYFINAIKGSNLIVWMALSIKFFKMWYERRQAANEAELRFLRSQINPHFLFNTLNNLYSLTLQQSPKSPLVVMGLSDIIRYMLYECNNDSILIKREIEIIESLISLEKIRYEERLDLNFSISGKTEDIRIAPLLLLPLVENAFKHGASEKTGQTWINIDLQIKSNKIKLKVSNSKPEKIPDELIRHKSNIGLSNLRRRLDLLYQDAYELKLYDERDMFAAILEVNLDLNNSLVYENKDNDY